MPKFLTVKDRISWNEVPRPSAPASPGNVLEMQIVELHPRPPESEAGDRAQLSKEFQWILEFENYWLKH